MKIKYFFLNIYYNIATIIYKIVKMYTWIYSIFFDSTASFDNKYSKYNNRNSKKRQYGYGYHTINNQENEYIPNNDIYTNETYDNITTDPNEHFFSDCDYEVLGVKYGSDFKTIVRPAYIELINKYHEDKVLKSDNNDKKELYKEISKRVNLAYNNLKIKNKK